MEKKTELLTIFINEKYGIDISISIYIIAAIIVIGIAIIAVKILGFKKMHALEIDEAELGIGTQKIKIKANYSDMQVAYKIWVEMCTRKIAIPIDYKYDIVQDIYKSWYEFFSITREYIKEIPVNRIKHQSTSELVNIAIKY